MSLQAEATQGQSVELTSYICFAVLPWLETFDAISFWDILCDCCPVKYERLRQD
jgi:hypothetical protein